MSGPPRLCLFARAPVLGQVKRRLARVLGETAALAAHVELLERALSRCARADSYATELWLAGEPPAGELVDRWVEQFPVCLRWQAGSDLGARMCNALCGAPDPSLPAVLIGSDCPDIDAAYVRGAFSALEQADLVLGPAADGGYGLIGLSVAERSLFEDVPWGESNVLSVTLEKATAAGLRIELLETIYDVDTPADWARYQDLRTSR